MSPRCDFGSVGNLRSLALRRFAPVRLGGQLVEQSCHIQFYRPFAQIVPIETAELHQGDAKSILNSSSTVTV